LRRIVLSWSSGKDSAWALHLLRQRGEFEVGALITTFNRSADRVAMHAVRRTLVRQQAIETGLPLWEIELPWPCSNARYEEIMSGVCRRVVAEGFDGMAFGDLFLTDVRAYREKQLAGTGIEPLFPVWGIPTGPLARDMIAAGVKAKLTCVDPRHLDRSFAGRDFDEILLGDLPPAADPCGENGEFHSFVYASPVFCRPIAIESGEIVERDGFVFADVKPIPI
jgi:uncharacterized protein (TIGR00290 family)